MAILRAELKGKGKTIHQTAEGGAIRSSVRGVFEGIVETTADLSLPEAGRCDAGSIMLCLADYSLYVKNSLCQWEAMTV